MCLNTKTVAALMCCVSGFIDRFVSMHKPELKLVKSWCLRFFLKSMSDSCLSGTSIHYAHVTIRSAEGRRHALTCLAADNHSGANKTEEMVFE